MAEEQSDAETPRTRRANVPIQVVTERNGGRLTFLSLLVGILGTIVFMGPIKSAWHTLTQEGSPPVTEVRLTEERQQHPVRPVVSPPREMIVLDPPRQRERSTLFEQEDQTPEPTPAELLAEEREELRSKALALVEFDQDLWDLLGDDQHSMSYVAAQTKTWELLEGQERLWIEEVPEFGNLTINARSALLYMALDITSVRGRVLKKEPWFQDLSAQLREWSSSGGYGSYRVARTISDSDWFKTEAPVPAARVAQLIRTDRFHRSILRQEGRDAYRIRFSGVLTPWYKSLSEPRQNALMELALSMDVAPMHVRDFHNLCGALASAVDAEQAEDMELAKRCYERAAQHIGPKSSVWAKNNPALSRCLATAVLENKWPN